ncbi:hypothetical protein N9D91_00820 [Planktomarina temperata]|jgi:putative transposase|nr:hypothetical protein [Planktomarina temperata]
MMIRKENTNLSLKRQCKLFNITRSSTYYTPVGLDQAKIDLMHEIDRIFTEYPFLATVRLSPTYLNQGFRQNATACVV